MMHDEAMHTDYCNQITALMNESRVLNDLIRDRGGGIRLSHDERWMIWKRRSLQEQQWELQRQAATEFAKLNGWKYSKADFSPLLLARGGTQHNRNEHPWDAGQWHDLFDRAVYFREPIPPYRPIAIVGQPYPNGLDEAAAQRLAAKLGLRLHTPPNLMASWWYPGSTRFFCFTRPGVSVRFIPDQCNIPHSL
jgi:hypothetical protein